MEKLFSFPLVGYDKRLAVSWNEIEIRQFQEAHNLKNIEVRFTLYAPWLFALNPKNVKTPLARLKSLFARLRLAFAKLTNSRVLLGRYNYLTRLVTLFIDVIIWNSFRDKCSKDAPAKEMAVILKQELPKVLSRALAHEFGHAQDIKNLLKWIFLDEQQAEVIAKEFTRQHAQELEPLFSVEEVAR